MNDQYLLPQDELYLPATMPAVFFSYHVLPDGSVRVLSADNRIKEIFGYAPEIFAQDTAIIFSLIHAADVARVREAIAESVRTVLPWHSEFRIQYPEQGEIWVEVQSAPQREQDGSMRWYGFVTDISKRKRNEALLQQSEKRYTAIVNAIHDAIILHDLEGKVLDVNQAMVSLYGITREDALKATIAQDLSGPGNPIETMPALWDRVVHGEKITFEWNARRPKDGVVFPIEVRLQRLTLDNQTLILATVRDATEQKQAEQTLRSSEARFKGLTDNLPGVVYQFYVRTNGDMGMYYFSKLSVPLFGLDVSNLDTVFQQFVDHVAPEDRERFVSSIAQAVQSFGGWDFEGRYIKTGGVELYFRGISKPRRLANEIVFDGVLLDITERKQAERKLQQLADLHQTILDTITTGLIFVKNRREQWANAAFCTMFGYAPDEVVDVDVAMLYAHDEDYRQSGIEAYPQLARGETHSREVQMKRKDGSIFWGHMVGKAINPENPFAGSVWMVQDITKRKDAEKKFKQLADLQETILDTITPGLSFVMDRRQQWTNASFCKIFGYDAAEVNSVETITFYADRADYELVGTEGYACLARGETYSHEVQMKRKDGSLFWCHMVGKAVNPEKLSEGSVWMLQDITERKKAEDALITSQALLRDSQRVAHIGCWNLDIHEKRLFWNEEAYEIYGFQPGEIQPTFDDFMAMVHPDDRVILLPHFQECMETGQFRDFECRIVRPDGSERTVYVAGKVAIDESGKPYRTFGIVQDITERKKAEEDKALLEAQLLQAQKMESVGRLAGGVAHDFNNMLGVILGCVDLMQSELTCDHPLMQYVLEIEKAATRSADITRQLLAFSRKQVITLKSIDLNAVIAATSQTLGRLIGEDIELCFQPCAALWKIKFDPSQLDQILINLAVNARDAMPRGGILNITTENLSLDEAYCRENIQCMPGEYVMLTVSDNGTGMDKETLTHIFEPFFTTKGVGMGTGLGLATIYGIVNQNAGSINVYSELGHGSTFKIFIPRNMEEEAPEERLAVMPLPQGAGTILLVEDDEMVRATTRIILREIGYTVLVADNAFEALLLCEKKDTHIDLLITDVIMPGMNGKDLRDKIESMRPGIKTLFMSGYPADIIAHSGVLEQGINFIQKPFNKNDLARKVSDIIRAG